MLATQLALLLESYLSWLCHLPVVSYVAVDAAVRNVAENRERDANMTNGKEESVGVFCSSLLQLCCEYGNMFYTAVAV